MLTLGLSATLRQCFRPKHYTETIFRLKISISKGLGCSSIDKTMTRDLCFRLTMLPLPTNKATYLLGGSHCQDSGVIVRLLYSDCEMY